MPSATSVAVNLVPLAKSKALSLRLSSFLPSTFATAPTLLIVCSNSAPVLIAFLSPIANGAVPSISFLPNLLELSPALFSFPPNSSTPLDSLPVIPSAFCMLPFTPLTSLSRPFTCLVASAKPVVLRDQTNSLKLICHLFSPSLLRKGYTRKLILIIVSQLFSNFLSMSISHCLLGL